MVKKTRTLNTMRICKALWLVFPLVCEAFQTVPVSTTVRLRRRRRHALTTLFARKPDDDGGLGEALDRAAQALEQSGAKTTTATPKRSRALWRVGWLAWWTQLILSVVSAVVLSFARAVTPTRTIDPLLGGGVVFSSAGLGAAFLSVIMAYRYTRLSKRDVSLDKIRASLRFGILVNLVGMLLTLISAEQVVGSLIAKLLLTPGALAGVAPGTTIVSGGIRPIIGPVTTLDAFIVQANTNTLFSHLAGISSALWLLSRSYKWK